MSFKDECDVEPDQTNTTLVLAAPHEELPLSAPELDGTPYCLWLSLLGRQKAAAASIVATAPCLHKWRSTMGQTALHLLVENDSSHLVDVWLQSKPDVDARDYNGQTPLHLARSAATVCLLAKAGARLLSDRRGMLPLHTFAEQGRYKPLEELVRRYPTAIGAVSTGKTLQGTATYWALHTLEAEMEHEEVAIGAVKSLQALMDRGVPLGDMALLERALERAPQGNGYGFACRLIQATLLRLALQASED